jgi:dTDP-glucose pyrophosphorylase
MVIIVPCAGLSSRFPNSLPKYLLSCYDGKMVLENVLADYLGKYKIYVTILKEHEEKFNIIRRLKYKFGDKITIVTLENRTKGAAETVYRTIKLLNFKDDTPFIVRDCDSFFKYDIKETGNYVYCEHINNGDNLLGKSYIETNNQNIVTNIIEKKIISEYFCVGGYQFNSVGEYKQQFESTSSTNGELYISEIIGNMINNGEAFVKLQVKNYIDVGTIKEFRKYNDKPTYFCDIDGVICKVQSRYDEKPFQNFETLSENCAALLDKLENGCQIIFTTARDEQYRKETSIMLDQLGFKDCQLLMNIHRSRRITINDYQDYYPTCEAICIESETNSLQKMLK